MYFLPRVQASRRRVLTRLIVPILTAVTVTVSVACGVASAQTSGTGLAPAPTVPPRITPTTLRPTPRAASVTKKPVAKTKTTRKRSKANGFGSGSRGDAVVALQTRLAELKYDITETEGKFGGQTYHAVMAFQKVNGLDRSGRATLATLAALETATDPIPLLPAGGADRIEIDIKGQYLAIYKEGALFKLLSISSGTGKPFCALDPETGKQACDVATTPGGSFRVQNRIVGFRESRLGLLYNPMYFNGGIAIHGSASVPAGPASHGCVRVTMASAEWLPTEITDGTPVYVFDGTRIPTPLKPKAGTTTSTAPGETTLPGATTIAPASTVATTSTLPGAARLLTTTTVAGAAPTSTVVVVVAATTTSTTTSTTTASTIPATTTTTKFQTP